MTLLILNKSGPGQSIPSEKLLSEELAEDPKAGKPLTGDLSFRFSYRVGVYRIVYLVNPQEKVVKILTAGHRGKVYR